VTASAARQAQHKRHTKETDISLELVVDGTGTHRVATPLPFFNHMLETFARHGCFDLVVEASGDVDVDAHHLVEDVGIVLGNAFHDALGERRGLVRYGHAAIPMDETLASCAVDFGGRAALVYDAPALAGRWVGGFDCELGKEFFAAFAQQVPCNLHLRCHYGDNAHHMLEALFKSFARACDAAAHIDPRRCGQVPSTKGQPTS